MPKTLLLADDSVTIQKVVGISFANEDVTLLTVDNGDDAIARTRESRPDIVLADVVMPGMNGYEVCEAIKSDPELRSIPVLLLTGTFEAFDEERAARAGADGHITKPFEAQALVDQVNMRLAQAAAPAPEPEPAPAAAPAAPSMEDSLGLHATPVPSAAGGESFDFFDEEITEPRGAPAGAPGAETVIVSDDFAVDAGSDDAFAFESGDELGDEMSASAGSGPAPEIATPAEMLEDLAQQEELAPDATVAILPDDDALSGALTEPPSTLPTLGEDDLAPFAPAEPPAIAEAPVEDLSSSLPEEPAPTRILEDIREPETPLDVPLELRPGAPDETLILSDLDTDPLGSPPVQSFTDSSDATPAESLSGHPLAQVEPGDLAAEAVVDPIGGRDYDVSSSDLGDPLAEDLAASHAVEEEPLSPWLAGPSALPEAEVVSEPACEAAEEEIPDPGPAEPETAPEAEIFSPPESEAAPEQTEVPWPAEPAALPEVELVSVLPPEAAPESDPGPLLAAAEEAPEPAAASSPDLSPLSREQLHESLERIAWDAFSDVTEQIVKEALERIERVAWEVIPQMAEALIREEIRKLKGEEE